MNQIKKILALSRPVLLIFSMLAYGSGLGIARYLGATLLPEPQFVGGVVVILFLVTSGFLTEYFRPANEPIHPGETSKEREDLRFLLLYSSLGLLAIVSVLVFFLARAGFLNIEVIAILVLFLILALANAVPPFRLVNRGLGELSTAIQISSLTPTLAFLLQFGKFHRLITLYTFPLLLLGLAYFLALNFPVYAEDMKYERKSMLISLTWQLGVPIHNAFMIVGYIFFAIIPFFGVPIKLVWPALLTLPIAAYQVFALRNLADGAKPAWSIFAATATAIYGLTIYLIALTFWLH
jgi:1,4-dihydroxy-2-naphthoate octaprenyltransferase